MFDVTDHSSFSSKPAPSDLMWRYMDLARYVSMLDSSALHFARVDTMEDKWEGAVSPATIQAYANVQSQPARSLIDFRKFLHQWAFINCWHQNPTESFAMWSIYQREGRGVAVRTTWQRLQDSIVDEATVYGGLVSYADYSTHVMDVRNVLNALMTKRSSFAHEREVRLVSLWSPPEEAKDSTRQDDSEPMEIEIDPDLFPAVIPIRVRLPELVESVFVSPDAPAWFKDVVAAITGKYGYSFSIEQSSLSGGPST